MMRHLLLSTCLLVSGALPLSAGEIVALCIGNNAYVIPEDQLDTPVNDARLMHRTLCAVPGVQAADIVLLEDARRSEITLALRQFRARAAEAKLSLVYYSGHGVEDTPTGYDRAETFLLPVDAVIENADDLPDKAVPLKTVLDSLEGTRGAARAVILDCCRSGAPGATKSLSRAGKSLSTLDENVKRALGGAILPEGTLIAFAASPGRKAAAFLTETDTNSPFTHFIAQEMSTQGRDLLSIINKASAITKQRTELRQVPHVELRGDVSLIMDYAIPAAGAVLASKGDPAARPRLRPLAEIMQEGSTTPSVSGTTGQPMPSSNGADKAAEVSSAPPSKLPSLVSMMLNLKKNAPQGSSVSPSNAGQSTQAQSAGNVVSVKLPRNVVMKFSYCPPGSFTMGSPPAEEGRGGDENQVQVRLTKAFWIAQTEVTQAQWEALMGSNPSEFRGPDMPVEHVSWEEAQAFIAKLNEKVFLLGGWSYALPTEAQWEYACRAGSQTAYAHGDDATQLFRHANFAENLYAKLSIGYNAIEGAGARTVAVGRLAANAWGIHDMHGNVREWCADHYGSSLVGGTDPTGPASGPAPVTRGGSWSSPAASCRSAQRSSKTKNYKNGSIGFRPVLIMTR